MWAIQGFQEQQGDDKLGGAVKTAILISVVSQRKSRPFMIITFWKENM